MIQLQERGFSDGWPGTRCIAQSGLELMKTLLPPLPKCWDYKHGCKAGVRSSSPGLNPCLSFCEPDEAKLQAGSHLGEARVAS